MPNLSSRQSAKVGKIRVGLLGSRPLATQVLCWMAKRADVELVGVVPPPFLGWWRETLETQARKRRIPIVSMETLFRKRPDLVLSVNYWRIIPERFLSVPSKGVVNLHHSYNLRLRGRYSTSFAIIRARRDRFWKHGTTLHYVTKTLDRGPVIATRSCPIRESDTAKTLFDRVEKVALHLFVDSFDRIIHGPAATSPPPRRSFFYSKRDGQIKEASLSWSAAQLYDFVRAWTFPGRPRPYIRYKRYQIYLDLNGA